MEFQRPSMRNPVHFLAFGFGSGLAPIAPGTFGTVAAMPIWWLCAQLPLWGYLAVTAAVIAVGPYLCGKTSDDMHVHDHPGIVWDEIAGLLITMIAVPITPWGGAGRLCGVPGVRHHQALADRLAGSTGGRRPGDHGR